MADSVYGHIKPQIEKLFLQTFGWKVSVDSSYSDKKMEKVCEKMGFAQMDECISSLSAYSCSTELMEALAHEFSIGESSFFRDKKFFETLEQKIIPQLLKNKRAYDKNINIWSVGCSSGEEAYSVAMMLDKNIPDIKSWNVLILGTDVNRGFLEKAKRGSYTKHSVRNIPEYYKNRYFKEIDDMYEVLPAVKKMVSFSFHNVAHKTLPLLPQNISFDLILLRNVLIYFDSKKAKETVDFLYSRLKRGGWLCTTPAEYASDIFDFYRSKKFSNESVVQKADILEVRPFLDLKPFFSSEQEIQKEIDTAAELPIPSTDKNDEEDQPLSCYLKASQLFDSGEIQEAKKCLRKSLYLDGDFIVGLISFGNILRKEGKTEESLRYIKKARELLERMNPDALVEYSDGMTADELLTIINYKNTSDKGLIHADG